MPQAQGTSRILNALPAPHTATVLMVNQALGNRAQMFLLSEQGGERVLDAIQRWRPDGVFGFSVTWAELARFDLSGYDLDSVRLWFNTGDASHEPHIRRLVAVGWHDTVTRDGVAKVPGSVFIDGLGSSEMGHSMFHITHRADTDRYGRCIGRPYQFAKVAVLDADGEPVPVGEVGFLGIDSPSLFRGYWNDSVTTYRFRQRGWYLTGDLVRADADGRYYHLDRAVDSVDAGGGRRFYTALSEERILAACPDVTDCTVVIVAEAGAVDHRRAAGVGRRCRRGGGPHRAGPRRPRPGRRGHAAPGGAGARRRHPGHGDRQGPQGGPARALPHRGGLMSERSGAAA